jgi:molecular chaperone Hsp33
VLRVLLALGEEELRQLADRAEATTVTCEFCKEPYAFPPEELTRLASLL